MASPGRYQLLKHLASGGMAEVYLARDRSPSGIEKLVVIKRVLPQHLKDPEFLRMFRDEARIGALLQHPNLVQMFEMGSLDGAPFISMEYLDGEDIRGIYKVLRQRGQPLSLEVTLTILAQVAAGLHYAHDRVGLDGKPLNIVHRDVSPQNVVVTFEGGVKVVDFGIAKAENRLNRTQNAVMKGKIAYMAPEQVTGEPLDRRTDVYALGVMLYEMTTGQRPFRRDNELATMRAIVEEPLTPPQKVVPGYAPELAAIVSRALARQAVDRFQSAQELQEALEKFARTRGFALSSINLSRFMRELFGARADAIREVLAGTRPAEELDGVGQSNDPDAEPAAPDTTTGISIDEVGPQTAAKVAAVVAPTQLVSTEHATVERKGPITVVHFRGKLNERFSGGELARALSGQVVFDLRQVERVTSFGVREWLAMLGACEARLEQLYLAHCSEAVVNQLSMIKRFAGPGRVVSFFAPYQCRACGRAFQALVEVEPHLERLERHEMPPRPCPACKADAEFDDDARSYLAFGPQPVGALHPVVETVLGDLARAIETPAEAVEKSIDGATTRVRVRAPLDGSIRWRKVLDGVEGEVCVELGEVPRFEDTGVRQLAAALGGMGGEVTRLVVEGAPRALLEQARAAIAEGRVKVGSIVVEGQCAGCNATRTAQLKDSEVEAALKQGKAPYATCKRCNGPLALGDVGWLASSLGHQRPAAAGGAPDGAPGSGAGRASSGASERQGGASGHAASGHGTSGHGTSGHGTSGHGASGHGTSGHGTSGHGTSGHGASGHGTSSHGTSGHGASGHGTSGHGTSSHGASSSVTSAEGARAAPLPRGLLAGVVALAVALVAVVGWSLLRSSASPVAGAAAPASAATAAATPPPAPAAAEGPPAWASGSPWLEEPSRILVWGHGRGADERAARAQAREACLAPVAERLLPSGPLAKALRQRVQAEPTDGEALRQALANRLGLPLEPLDESLASGPGGVQVWLRYALPRPSIDAALAAVALHRVLRGATLLLAPPQLAAAPREGALYVAALAPGSAALRAGLREGDLVLEVAGQPAASFERLDTASAAFAERPLSVKVKADGITRTLTLPR